MVVVVPSDIVVVFTCELKGKFSSNDGGSWRLQDGSKGWALGGSRMVPEWLQVRLLMVSG